MTQNKCTCSLHSLLTKLVMQAMLPLLKRAAVKGTGMGIHRAAVINMSSLLGSVELYWGERANSFKWYPYRASKVSQSVPTLFINKHTMTTEFIHLCTFALL